MYLIKKEHGPLVSLTESLSSTSENLTYFFDP
jgi:hypothetical protein